MNDDVVDVAINGLGEIEIGDINIEVAIDTTHRDLVRVNAGPHRSREISLAITALEEAGLWLLKDRMNRQERGN